ncbi:rod-binding protein [Oceanibacterium hippocampi]|uniref:Chemotactic signal-response protein CheL n=1 Tax=Oceanibacterium hippocampi TaxID=745714 RepID=A0A1Y5TZD1_9PROT|nr:rod-binding protein [Oceanibacterium hippocampi]SLN77138.1 chemotactic signal-response protein CheL [Oceanibacterium hippocampi]
MQSDMLDSSTMPTAATLRKALAHPRPGQTELPDRALDAAKDFEAVFLTEMLKSMWAGIETDGPFGGGHGEEMFRSLLTEEYSKTLSRAGGLGISDAVHREILALQEIHR